MSERISALVDGELEASEATSLLATIHEDDASRQDWHDYHLIGDILRQTPVSSPGFANKISARLKNEPTVLSPHKFTPPKREFFAWAAAASFAAVAFVALASFKFAAAPGGIAGQENLAMNTITSSQPAPELNEYLAAHQEFSPGTALQANSNFAQVTYTQHQDIAR